MSSKCNPNILQHQPYPQKIHKPAHNPSKLCTKPNGQKILCGYASREQKSSNEFYPHVEGNDTIFIELKFCNKSPITLDIYHRLKNSKKFVFSGSIPTMQDMYVYKDKENQPFSVDDEIFATRRGETDILYLPEVLKNMRNQLFFGASTAQTDESITIVNLLSEIGHIKFRNYSFATYTLYYYGEYLGELKPFDRDSGTYFELYVARSNQGFRLGSQISIVMNKTNIAQNIALTHRTMTTLNVGLVTSQPNFS